MSSPSKFAQPVSLAEYQRWLLGIGIYAKDSDWGNHDTTNVLFLFKKIWVGIDFQHAQVFSIVTDNPLLHAEVGDFFNGTILDKLNVAIIDMKYPG